jgi:hypothetical protein
MAANIAQRTLRASVVETYKGAGGEDKNHWTDVGVAFPHKDGKGYNIVIRKGISLSGEIVLRESEPKEDSDSKGGTSVGTETNFS